MSKKRSRKVKNEEDVEVYKDFGDLADLVRENVIESESQDVFEEYAHQLRSHLHSNKDNFKNHFSEGYLVLLEELRKKSIP